MSLATALEPVPLSTDAHGVVRVAGTRVTLDTLVEAFNEGLTAEEIVQQYPSLPLADVYAVIGYYLHRRQEVDAYVGERRKKAQEMRDRNRSKQDALGIRERLLSRRGHS